MKLLITQFEEIDGAVATYLAGPRGHVEVEAAQLEYLNRFATLATKVSGIPFQQVTAHLLPRCAGKVEFFEFADVSKLLRERCRANLTVYGVSRDGPIFAEIHEDGRLIAAAKLADDIDLPIRPRSVLGQIPVAYTAVCEVYDRILSTVQR